MQTLLCLGLELRQVWSGLQAVRSSDAAAKNAAELAMKREKEAKEEAAGEVVQETEGVGTGEAGRSPCACRLSLPALTHPSPLTPKPLSPPHHSADLYMWLQKQSQSAVLSGTHNGDVRFLHTMYQLLQMQHQTGSRPRNLVLAVFCNPDCAASTFI